MAVNRRGLLKAGVAAVTGVLAPIGTAVTAARRHPDQPPPSPAVRPFSVPLPIPPVLKPVSTSAGVDRYEIRQRAADMEILPGLRTQIWGYEGRFPGPTIEVRTGRTAIVRQVNELPVPTVVHLHGGVTAPEHDGYPLDYILPTGASTHPAHAGQGVGGVVIGSREYEYPNRQPAATLWYHDHRMDYTGPQVYRGLAGLYLIRDDVEDALPLPRGEREIPLVLADRWFHPDGSLFYPSRDPKLLDRPGVIPAFGDGLLGDTILVNGAPWPYAEVSAARYRLRILNASNRRPYLLRLDPAPPGGGGFVQIGSELGLLPRPLFHDELMVGVAERYDVIVDFSRYPVGTKVVLRNAAGDTGPTAQVMRFDVVRSAQDDTRIPATLRADEETLDPEKLEPHRRFLFIVGRGGGASTINFRKFDPARVDVRAQFGSTERWQVITDGDHPVHVHGGQFRVLSRVNSPPAAQDAGWKDTVLIRGGEVDLAVRYAGFRGKYLMHCHNLEHEDMSMMTNVEVI
ncbi:MAG TPA: multicopper oxidase family protein [Micromonosporaceae bacterium]|nr:multicopper oxidase family protein [Micromonosporaceae bacterium]